MSSPHLPALVLLVALAGLAAAQTPRPDAEAEKALLALTLPTDDKAEQRLAVAADFVKKEDWRAAVELLQLVLDGEQDAFVRVRTRDEGKDITRFAGAHAEAERILAGMPAAGRQLYQKQFGEKAAERVEAARKKEDALALTDVVQRYLYTDTGAEAAETLATHHLDRGEYFKAARTFDRLLQRRGLNNLGPITLFKAALAFHAVGDKENKEKVWKRLVATSPKGIKLGERELSLTELEKELEKAAGKRGSVHDFLMFGGDASRTSQGKGGAPFLAKVWYQPMTADGQVKNWIYEGTTSARAMLEARGQAVLPGYLPITTTVAGRDGKPVPILIFRSYSGVSAVNLKTGKLAWVSPSNWSFERMLRDSQKQQALSQWVQYYKDASARPYVPIENSTIGTLSADRERVYVVEDLAVPPANYHFDPRFSAEVPPKQPLFNQAVNDATLHNRLQAIEAASGKLKWELGGRSDGKGPRDAKDFRDGYFLGPPLPLEGRLYLLHEKEQEIRLVCLDTARIPERPSVAQLKDAVAWVQPLGTARDTILMDFGRRIHAAHVAHGEGVLVCPTNAGTVFGVDLLTHQLLWAHTYREPEGKPAAPPPPGRRPPRVGGLPPVGWKVSAPAVSEGKVVFTAPDADVLRCLSLRDGRLVWSQERQEGDLYFAGVFAGRAVVVGKTYCRALGLADGKEAWRLETGMPSGRGAASENLYYLPLLSSAAGKEPEVIALDVAEGKVVAHARSRPRLNAEGKHASDVPGNLLFADGLVVSQGLTEVAAYPQLHVKLQKMNELLEKNPNDPVALFERGELRLDRGELLGAVEDLLLSLKHKPPKDLEAKVRAKLREALTELLRSDFGAGEKYLKEYEALSRVEIDPEAPPDVQAEQKAEGVRLRAAYLALVGRGYESQGKVLPALEAYLELAGTGDRGGLLALPGEPALKVAPDAWAAGRIAAMAASAKPASRQLLEDEAEKRLQAARKAEGLDDLRRLVAALGSFKAGREARLALAERLIGEGPGLVSVVEVEALLLPLTKQKEDEQQAARALEALARLMLRKGLLEDALHYYRTLARDYPKTVIRDGKTGADYFNDLVTDKRFLPYLEEKPRPGGKLKAREEVGNFPMAARDMVYEFEADGEALPYLRRHRLALNHQTNHVQLTDRRTGEPQWSERLRATDFGRYLPFLNAGNPDRPGPRFTYRAVGHLIVLNLGQAILALDPVGKKVLWQRNLLDPPGLPPGAAPQLDPADGTLRLLFPDGYVMTVGQVGPASEAPVCVQTREGLTAFDPRTGRALWTLGGVPAGCRVFGDDKHVCVVERNADGKPVATRAFRALDGAAVKVPDFTALYGRQTCTVGGRLLLSEGEAGKEVVLRLYDVPSGKDVWRQTFPAGSVVLQTEEPDLAAVVTPKGEVRVTDLATQKEVLSATVRPELLKGVTEGHLLADGDTCYVMLRAEGANERVPAWWSNVQPASGLRVISVNGAVWAFDRGTGKLRWENEVPHQQMVLTRWKELPVLLFTARQPKTAGGLGLEQTVAVESFEKSSGKYVFHRVYLPATHAPFHSISHDPRTGKVELVGDNYKVTLASEAGAP
jgi:outer membrane protein assembly factor BamB